MQIQLPLLLSLPTHILPTPTNAALNCNPSVFGHPKFDDCLNAMVAMPEGHELRQPTEELTAFRKFIEPQSLTPPFRPVKNELEAGMVQLPKIFRSSQSFPFAVF